MHNVLPTYEQRLPGALGTYTAYVKRVIKRTQRMRNLRVAHSVVSVRYFIYKKLKE